jgi:hypothetical protein
VQRSMAPKSCVQDLGWIHRNMPMEATMTFLPQLTATAVFAFCLATSTPVEARCASPGCVAARFVVEKGAAFWKSLRQRQKRPSVCRVPGKCEREEDPCDTQPGAPCHVLMMGRSWAG